MKQKPLEKRDPPSLADMVITFVRASGLRRTELEALRQCDVVYESIVDRAFVFIKDEGKGRPKVRVVPVLKDHKDDILYITSSRTKAKHDLIFPVVPPDLPLDESRRWYARQLYEEILQVGHDQGFALHWVMDALAETSKILVKQYCSESLSLPPHHS